MTEGWVVPIKLAEFLPQSPCNIREDPQFPPLGVFTVRSLGFGTENK